MFLIVIWWLMGTYSKPAKQLVKLNKRQVKQGFWELIIGMGGHNAMKREENPSEIQNEGFLWLFGHCEVL